MKSVKKGPVNGTVGSLATLSGHYLVLRHYPACPLIISHNDQFKAKEILHFYDLDCQE